MNTTGATLSGALQALAGELRKQAQEGFGKFNGNRLTSGHTSWGWIAAANSEDPVIGEKARRIVLTMPPAEAAPEIEKIAREAFSNMLRS